MRFRRVFTTGYSRIRRLRLLECTATFIFSGLNSYSDESIFRTIDVSPFNFHWHIVRSFHQPSYAPLMMDDGGRLPPDEAERAIQFAY